MRARGSGGRLAQAESPAGACQGAAAAAPSAASVAAAAAASAACCSLSLPALMCVPTSGSPRIARSTLPGFSRLNTTTAGRDRAGAGGQGQMCLLEGHGMGWAGVQLRGAVRHSIPSFQGQQRPREVMPPGLCYMQEAGGHPPGMSFSLHRVIAVSSITARRWDWTSRKERARCSLAPGFFSGSLSYTPSTWRNGRNDRG